MARKFKQVLANIDSLSCLPSEAMLGILKNLLPQDLNKLARSSKKFSRIINNDRVIMQLYEARGFHHIRSSTLDNVKQDYMDLHREYFGGLDKFEQQLFLDAQVGNLASLQNSVHEYANSFKLRFFIQQPLFQFDRRNNSLLHWAARNGHANILKYLLDIGHRINFHNNRFNSALHLAARHNNYACVVLLLQRGARSWPNRFGVLPIACASKYKVIKYFLEHGADVNARLSNSDTILQAAIKKRKLKLVKLILKHNPDLSLVDNSGYNAIETAVKLDAADVLQELINAGNVDLASTYRNGNNILHLAAEYGSLDCLKLLLETGMDMAISNNSNQDIMHLACKHGKENIVDHLIRIGYSCKRDLSGNYPIHIAAQRGNVSLIQKLANYAPGLLNLRNNNSSTALHELLCSNTKLDITPVLQIPQLDLEIQNNTGKTPLLIATHKGKNNDIAALINANADTLAADNSGCTALIYAALSGKAENLRLLLQKQYDLNARCNNGNTALIRAAIRGHLDCVRELVAAGADIEVRNNNGSTAYELAEMFGSRPVVKELIGERLLFEWYRVSRPLKFLFRTLKPSLRELFLISSIGGIYSGILFAVMAIIATGVTANLIIPMAFIITMVASMTLGPLFLPTILVALVSPIFATVAAVQVSRFIKPITTKIFKAVNESILNFGANLLRLNVMSAIKISKQPTPDDPARGILQTLKISIAKLLIRFSAFCLGKNNCSSYISLDQQSQDAAPDVKPGEKPVKIKLTINYMQSEPDIRKSLGSESNTGCKTKPAPMICIAAYRKLFKPKPKDTCALQDLFYKKDPLAVDLQQQPAKTKLIST